MYGAHGHFGLSLQSSGGTANTASFTWLPLTGEGILHEIDELVEGDFTRYQFLEGPVHRGMQRVRGPVDFEPYPQALGLVLNGAVGTCISSIEAGSSYTHRFVCGVGSDFDSVMAQPPYTSEIYRGVGSAFQFQDVQFTGLKLTQEPGQFLKASAELFGRVGFLKAAATPSWEAGQPWRWDQCSVSLGGAAFIYMESFEFTLANKVEPVDAMVGSFWFSHTKRTGVWEVRLNGNMSFPSQAELVKYMAGSQQPLVINYLGSTQVGSHASTGPRYAQLTINIPQFRYSTFPTNMANAGRIVVPFTGRGATDTTSLYCAELALVNSVVTY